jgi:hypothetical protein
MKHFGVTRKHFPCHVEMLSLGVPAFATLRVIFRRGEDILSLSKCSTSTNRHEYRFAVYSNPMMPILMAAFLSSPDYVNIFCCLLVNSFVR